ncbi:hypothetical protein SKAU_G00115920 [Synaphobranchus kaupii]|uniref:Uncharacterized protein n=1 Tax=Synaphobranchus kaupii TaxID=118154 RepID=A0A9Q1FN23_SYNKA|nr:hypothetical protein SKAU_G00115920 [Synaphobranchus kaupii]
MPSLLASRKPPSELCQDYLRSKEERGLHPCWAFPDSLPGGPPLPSGTRVSADRLPDRCDPPLLLQKHPAPPPGGPL